MVKITLPQAESKNSISLENALKQRETKREYLSTPLSLTHLSKILFAAQGMQGNVNKRTAPSAQEQYPISTFVIANKVTELSSGLYQYQNSDHSLTEIKIGPFSDQLEEAALGEQV